MPKKTLRDLKDFEKLMNKQIPKGMQAAGILAQSVVKKHVDQDVYGAGKPVRYQRTGDLRDSVVFEQNEISETYHTVTIFNDPQLIRAVGYPEWQHYSRYESKDGSYPLDYSAWIAETVEYGTSGSAFGEGYWTEPRPFMANAATELRADGGLVLKQTMIAGMGLPARLV